MHSGEASTRVHEEVAGKRSAIALRTDRHYAEDAYLRGGILFTQTYAHFRLSPPLRIASERHQIVFSCFMLSVDFRPRQAG